MNITIFGTGYVGLVSGACFADRGHHVVCVDVDSRHVEKLSNGQCPIYEPGLEDLIRHGLKEKRLEFSTNAQYGVEHAEVIFIAVGTPTTEAGAADLRYVEEVAATVGQHINAYKVIATKSTVPIGTSARLKAIVQQEIQRRQITVEFDIASNPEFLKEGAAVQDFSKPDRVILGVDTERAEELLRNIYTPGQLRKERIIVMDPVSAELTKYAANYMLATKISVMNELSNICDKVGADIEWIREGIGSDSRIGYDFIYPGCGFGGSCFPKDLRALASFGQEIACNTPILNAVIDINEYQKNILFQKMQNALGDLKGLTVGLWGLSFKPNTNDVREAPSRVLMESLWAAGAKVRAYDPVAMPEIQLIYGDRPDLCLCDSSDEVLDDADVLAVVTEWNIFRNPDYRKISEKLRKPMIFDGRNIYDPEICGKHGICYYGIGRRYD